MENEILKSKNTWLNPQEIKIVARENQIKRDSEMLLWKPQLNNYWMKRK